MLEFPEENVGKSVESKPQKKNKKKVKEKDRKVKRIKEKPSNNLGKNPHRNFHGKSILMFFFW